MNLARTPNGQKTRLTESGECANENRRCELNRSLAKRAGPGRSAKENMVNERKAARFGHGCATGKGPEILRFRVCPTVRRLGDGRN